MNRGEGCTSNGVDPKHGPMTMTFGRFLRLRRNESVRLLMTGLICVGLTLGTIVALVDAPAPVEMVHFTSGEVMSIAGHHVEGDAIVLSLKGGGEVLFDAQLIERIEPVVMPAPQPVVHVAPVEEAQLPAKPYAALVRRTSDRHRVDADILHAVIEAESGYRPDAESPRGAKGLMQLMPDTVARYNVRDPFDPAANIDAGARHLRQLFDQFGMRGGLAAYNAGEGSVRRFHGVPPYPETHRYVDRVLEIVDETRMQDARAQDALAQ